MKGEDSSQEWDGIHFGLEEPDVIDPKAVDNDDDDIDPRKTFDTDEGLEGSAYKLDDDDDDDAPAPTKKGGEGDDNEAPAVPVTDQSGIELYLSQFDIEAGMIQFEDGTALHFNDLDANKQAEVLQQLHTSQAKTVEDQFGLEEDEIGLLNYLRSNNLSVEDMVESMVQERVSNMISMQDLAQEDYTKMESDALYIKFLKDTSPEATPEQITADLEKAKELSNYSKLTENLRAQFISQQEAELQEQANAAQASRDELIETQRQEIVNVVQPMKEIAGIELDQNIKNTVLDHILETNEEGDSAFMDEVFSDPQSLFKAAFWYVYGESLVAQRDEYWKKEKSAAYKRGKEDALGIAPKAQGKTFISKQTPKPDPTRPGTTRKKETDDAEDWSTLHD